MILALCEAPTHETRPHHNTGESAPYPLRSGNAEDAGGRPSGLYSHTFYKITEPLRSHRWTGVFR